MAPNTVKTGIGVLDNAFGGIYLNFPTLVCGRRKSGKFIFATQVLARALRIGERAILFTSKRPEDIVSSMGTESLDVDEAISSGQLIICPYSSMHRNGSDPYAALQFPEVLDELSAIMKSEKIAYAVFDTVVPWTAIEPTLAFRPFLSPSLASFSTNGIQGPAPSGPAFVESARTPQPSQATPPPPLRRRRHGPPRHGLPRHRSRSPTAARRSRALSICPNFRNDRPTCTSPTGT